MAEEAQQPEEAAPEEEAPPHRLLLKIFGNDPEVTSLDLGSVSIDLGDPDTDPTPPWWWGGNFDPSDFRRPQDDDKLQVYATHCDEAIRALECNHTIDTVRVDAYFRYETRSTKNKELFRRMLRVLTRLPSLESFTMEDEHQCRVDEFIDAINSKLKVLKIRHVSFGSADGVARVAEKLRDHPTLEEVFFDTQFLTSNEHQEESRQVLVLDTLVDALASIPNLRKLTLLGSTISSAEVLQKIVRHHKLMLLSLCNVHLGENLYIAIAEALMKDKGNLEVLDLSSSYFLGPFQSWHEDGHTYGLTQASSESLFRLVEQQPTLKVRVSYHFNHRETKAFYLDSHDDVEWYLQKEEIKRGIRMNDAGLSKVLRAEGTPFSEWAEVMAKVSADTIALFHILRENPMICDPNKPAKSPPLAQGKKVSPPRSKKRKHSG